MPSQNAPDKPLRGEFMGTKCPACGHQFGRIMPDQSKEELVRLVERWTTESRGLLEKWRIGIIKLEAGVKDSPSYDLRRMIKERAEMATICANELEALLGKMGAP